MRPLANEVLAIKADGFENALPDFQTPEFFKFSN
jgi:hypothetical protein